MFILSRPRLLRCAQVACHVTGLQCTAITSHMIRSLDKSLAVASLARDVESSSTNHSLDGYD